jgi:TolA-binding protein
MVNRFSKEISEKVANPCGDSWQTRRFAPLFRKFLLRNSLFLILLTLGFSARLAFAADTHEAGAFDTAMRNFKISKELSVQDFADFVRKYPTSIRRPEAILYEAQGMLYGGEATNAIQLLSNNHVDKLAPQYLYWLGQAYFQNGEYEKATNTFGQMIEEFSGAADALDATIRQANAFVHLDPPRWPLVVQLLSDTNKPFQRALRDGTVSETVASGFLLLGEAQLAMDNNAGVESTLQALEKQKSKLTMQLKWQRDYLAARLQRAEGRLDDALQTSDGLIGALDRTNRAEGVAFRGGVLEQLGNLTNLEEAASIYTNNLAADVPADQQQRAILKIAELDLKLGKLPDAVENLAKYLELKPAPEASDLALLTLGEARMEQAAKGDTNLFDNALAQFAKLTNSYPNSPVIGKALLDQGWCLWSQGRIAASQESFRSAVDHLPFSVEQAEARFKWADTQFAARDFAAAVTNYNSVAEKYASLPEAKGRLIERALYQSARAALNEHDLAAASSALKNIIAWYPNSFGGPSALLLAGQEMVNQNDPAGARKLFAEFVERYPDNPLRAEVRLAIGRSFEAEGNWDAAITNYASWSSAFTNHYLMPQAQFRLAWDQYMAGRETNALMLFTNFIAHYPTNELSARAQFWIGDFYFRQGDSQAAEINYKAVFQNTNWPVSELTYEARMSAGRAAVARFSYKDAINYFTNLFTPDCPHDLQVQANIAFADATINEDSTNKTADLLYAISSLQIAVESSSNSWESAQAWGRIGDCYFELAAKDPSNLTNATNAYLNVIEAPAARRSAKEEARFKLAAAIERQAALKTGDEQGKLVKEAWRQYVTVFDNAQNDPEGASPLWVKKSGVEAGRLAESLQEWKAALRIYGQLKDLLPGMAPVFDKKIAKASEHH